MQTYKEKIAEVWQLNESGLIWSTREGWTGLLKQVDQVNKSWLNNTGHPAEKKLIICAHNTKQNYWVDIVNIHKILHIQVTRFWVLIMLIISG